jgi:hypothetical protein
MSTFFKPTDRVNLGAALVLALLCAMLNNAWFWSILYVVGTTLVLEPVLTRSTRRMTPAMVLGVVCIAGLVVAAVWQFGLGGGGSASAQTDHSSSSQSVPAISGSGNAIVTGTNSGTVIGTQNNSGPVTITHPVKVVHADTNEGVLVPGHMPTPPDLAALAAGAPKDALKVFYGNNVAIAAKLPLNVLMMAGDPMIQIDRKAGSDSIVITVLRIFDDRDNIIARIDADGFWVENSTRKKRPDPHTLVVFDHTDTEVLRIVFLNKEAIFLTGIFRHAGIGFPVIVTPTYMDINTNRLSGMSSVTAGGAVISIQ